MPFNLGGPELMIVLVIILIVFGAGRLPNVMKDLGSGVREFKKAQTETEEAARSTASTAPAAPASGVVSTSTAPAAPAAAPGVAPGVSPVSAPGSVPAVPAVPAVPDPRSDNRPAGTAPRA